MLHILNKIVRIDEEKLLIEEVNIIYIKFFY